tara:strand:+ start:21093 stop:21665 length:573 start_codon:yes stop_codon:yes gene_type:complete
MDHLNQLKIKSLFKKYDYYSSEIEWREEYISENENDFIKYTQDIINSNEELKELYDLKREKKKEKISEKIQNTKDLEKSIDHKSKDPKLKKLFRKVVKETHPDKVKSRKLNKMYMKVVKSYDSDDLLDVYRICNELNIDYTLELDEKYIIKETKKLQSRIIFLENSYIYRWINDEKKRDKIALEYINQQL